MTAGHDDQIYSLEQWENYDRLNIFNQLFQLNCNLNNLIQAIYRNHSI